MRSHLSLAILSCYLTLCSPPVYGCRYNVREIGFIDVGVEAYRFIVYLPQDVTPQESASLKETVEPLLTDSNVRFEIVVAGADANQPAMRLFAGHGITSLPAAVLISPDGQSMPVSLSVGTLGQVVSAALDSVLRSATRQKILEKVADAYGVVLLMEGPQPDRNAQAREIVATAIGRVNEQLGLLPKPIARPPVMVTLDQQSLDRERVLLWSLGLKPEDIDEPHVAVFYGRGRWIGPLFKGDRLAANPLTQVLLVIGADCECDLDHRFLQGTMFPVRWDEGLQQEVAESIGFDPEDPMVKMEMVSIIRRGLVGFDGPSMPLADREVQVSEEVPQDARPAAANDDSLAQPVSSSSHSATHNPQSKPGGWEFRVLAVSLGGMTAFVAVASLVIVLRARKT